MNSNSKTLARRRKIMAGMLNKDFLYERPPTAESLHHTSVASDLSEGREKDLDDMEVRDKLVLQNQYPVFFFKKQRRLKDRQR